MLFEKIHNLHILSNFTNKTKITDLININIVNIKV